MEPLSLNDVNEIFAPYLQELAVSCSSISEAIDAGVVYSECPIQRLKGKLSGLRGILKGIELAQTKVAGQFEAPTSYRSATFNIDSLRGRRFTKDEIQTLENLIGADKANLQTLRGREAQVNDENLKRTFPDTFVVPEGGISVPADGITRTAIFLGDHS